MKLMKKRKRIIIICMTLVMLFVASCAPGGRATAEEFIDAKLAIGIIEDTPVCREQIEKACLLYGRLSDSAKYSVDKIAASLEKLVEEFNSLTTGAPIVFKRDEMSAPDDGNTENNNQENNNNNGNGNNNNNGTGNSASDYDAATDPAALTFLDNFDGTALNEDNWIYENKGDGFGNDEKQFYRPENIEVADGMLRLVAKKEHYEGKDNTREYTSAKIMSRTKFFQTYGRFEARIRLSSATTGFWPAFWMMPEKNEYGGWPRSGEIDIMEMRGRVAHNASSAIHFGPSHRYTYCDNNEGNDSEYGFNITDFHIYTVDWQEGKISFYIDGKFLYSMSSDGKVENAPAPAKSGGAKNNQWEAGGIRGGATPFNKNFYMILNLAIGGQFDNGRNPPDEIFEEKQFLEIDFVRAFSLNYMIANPFDTPETPDGPEIPGMTPYISPFRS